MSLVLQLRDLKTVVCVNGQPNRIFPLHTFPELLEISECCSNCLLEIGINTRQNLFHQHKVDLQNGAQKYSVHITATNCDVLGPCRTSLTCCHVVAFIDFWTLFWRSMVFWRYNVLINVHVQVPLGTAAMAMKRLPSIVFTVRLQVILGQDNDRSCCYILWNTIYTTVAHLYTSTLLTILQFCLQIYR